MRLSFLSRLETIKDSLDFEKPQFDKATDYIISQWSLSDIIMSGYESTKALCDKSISRRFGAFLRPL